MDGDDMPFNVSFAEGSPSRNSGNGITTPSNNKSTFVPQV